MRALAPIALLVAAGCGGPAVDEPGRLVVLTEDAPGWDVGGLSPARDGSAIDRYRAAEAGGREGDALGILMREAAQLPAGTVARVLSHDATPGGVPFVRVAVVEPIGDGEARPGDERAIERDRLAAAPAD